MYVLRSTLEVRTVPERVMEWLLLFVSPAQFEAALQRFGFDAKRYGLAAAVLGMLTSLALLGYVALRRAWPLRSISALGLGLWLFVMLVVMPLTSAGAFAMDLIDGTRAAIGGYLAVALTFAAVLALVHAWSSRRDLPAARPQAPRRVVLAMIGRAGVAYLATYLAVRLLPKDAGNVASVMLEDPQEPVPSGGIEPRNPHPNVVGTPLSADASPVPQAPAPVPRLEVAQSTPPTPGRPPLPEPASVRQVMRDTDGAVLPGGRAPGELAAPITRTDDFYVVTKNAGGDPVIHPQDWRLLIDGDVDRPSQLDYATLRKMASVEITRTLECISNYVGQPELAPFGAELISTAVWRGVRVRDVLALAGGSRPSATWVAVVSADEFTSALPVAAIMDPDTLLVYEMNGAVLPREHGYPLRLLVPGRYGMKNVKWVIGLRLLTRQFTDWYGQRNWSREGVVQTMVRIDSPAPRASRVPGPLVIAGIAYAGARGVHTVEYSADDGQSWRTAELVEPAAAADAWVRWRAAFTVPATDEQVVLRARATDGTGQVQTEAFSLPEPDGGTGWPRLEVRRA